MELKDLRALSGLKECGPMATPMSPPTPASVSMTAASGSELSGMLKDIMSLAGLQKVEPHHLGVEPAPMKLLPEPVKAVGPAASDSEVMRGIADKLNLDKDEEEEKKADEAWDNTPEDPRTPPEFDAEEFANHENPPGAGKGRRTMQPNATVEEIAEHLFAEYQNFLAEDSEEDLDELRNPDSNIKPGSLRDINRQRMAAAAKKGIAHQSGAQPSHSGAPAKTSKGEIVSKAKDVKAQTDKSEYRGRQDDVGDVD